MRRRLLAIATLVGGASVVLATAGLLFPVPETSAQAVVWTEPIGSSAPGPSGPSRGLTASEELVVYTEGGSVNAIDPENGAIRWLHSSATGALSVAAGPQAVVLRHPESLAALDPDSGQELWRYETDAPMSWVDWNDRVLLFSTERTGGGFGYSVAAVDLGTGRELWSRPGEGFWAGSVAVGALAYAAFEQPLGDDPGDHALESTVVAHRLEDGVELWRATFPFAVQLVEVGQTLVMAGAEEMLGLEAASGREVWRRPMPHQLLEGGFSRIHHFFGAETSDRDLVLFPGVDTAGTGEGVSLIALDASSGEELWREPISGTFVSDVRTTNDRAVVMATNPRQGLTLQTLALSSGEAMWTEVLAERIPNEQSFPGPAAVVDGMAVAVDPSGMLRAFDLSDGEELWSTRPPGSGVAQGGPQAADGSVYFAGPDGLLRALRGDDGETLWQRRVGLSGFSQPVLEDGTLYVATGLGAITALASGTGEELWKSQNLLEAVENAHLPVVAQGAVVSAAGRLVWSASTGGGAHLWEVELPSQVIGLDQSAGVVIADRTGTIRMLDPGTGGAIWERQVATSLRSGPVADGRTVLVVTGAGDLLALDPASGDTLWTAALPGASSPPAITDRAVLAPAGTRLHGFDPSTGAPLWELDVEEALVASPTTSGERAYLSTAAGAVLIVDAARGELVGRVEIEEAPVSPPAVANGIIYVVTSAGNLVALR